MNDDDAVLHPLLLIISWEITFSNASSDSHLSGFIGIVLNAQKLTRFDFGVLQMES